MFDYDFLVIGAGSGGVRASRKAAETGARVAVIESQALGGTCVNIGCVPKKLFVYGSQFPEELIDAEGYGYHFSEVSWDWQTLLSNKNKEIKRLNGIYEKLLNNAGVEVIRGFASFVDNHTVSVGDKQFSAEKILIASGGQPTIPDISGKEHIAVSDEMFYLPTFPKRVIIVGGGYIATEFAGIFNGLGAETTLLYRGDLPLRGFDDDLRRFTCEQMQEKGVQLLTQTSIESIEKLGENNFNCQLNNGKVLNADLVFYATGRHPNTKALALDKAGVSCQGNGAIKVDQYYQTNINSIYAIGDVTDNIQLTPVAIKEAMALVQTLFHNNPSTVDYDYLPKAVFSQPNLATVGYTEAEAREQFGEIKTYQSIFKPMKQSLSARSEKIMMKLIVEQKTDKVVGAHMAGEHSAEIIQGLAVALKAGATKAIFDATIGIHPSAAEEFVTMS